MQQHKYGEPIITGKKESSPCGARLEIETMAGVSLRSSPAYRLILSIVILLNALLLPRVSLGQWKPLIHHRGDLISAMYFQDLPGPPLVGIAGGYDSIYRTTDAGATWTAYQLPPSPGVYPKGGYLAGAVFDFAFKDNLTGWAATEYGCWKTTDGGITWSWSYRVTGDPFKDIGANYGTYYDKKTKGLFLGSYASPLGWCTIVSWDEGQTWNRSISTGNYGLAGYSFLNDDSGLVAGYIWWRTTDGGITWNPLALDSLALQPLAIPGTQTYFMNTMYGKVLRSDDGGDTWKLLSTFPPQPYLAQGNSYVSSDGYIRGDLNNLFVVLTSGCYRSTDQGITWHYLCGQGTTVAGIIGFLYVRGNYIYMSNEDTTGIYQHNPVISPNSLWMLDLDSMQYFGMHFGFADGSKRLAVQTGDTASVYYKPQTDTLIGINSAHFVVRFDRDALGVRSYKIPNGWKVVSSNANGSTLDLWLAGDTTVALPDPVLQVNFNTYLSPEDHPLPPSFDKLRTGSWKGGGSTFVYLDSARLYGKRLNCDCAALSIAAPDSVEIDFTGCGDSTLVHYMRTGTVPFTIESIQPNPARDEIAIVLSEERAGVGAHHAGFELSDALGRPALSGVDIPPTLNVSGLPSGVYYLRLSQDGFVVTQRVVIER